MAYVGGTSLERNQTPIHRKLVLPAAGGGKSTYVDFQARPFSRLAMDDYLGTADLCLIFGCSARTVYRWVADNNLRPSYTVSREFLFTKAEVLRWYENDRPTPGRPPMSGG